MLVACWTARPSDRTVVTQTFNAGGMLGRMRESRASERTPTPETFNAVPHARKQGLMTGMREGIVS